MMRFDRFTERAQEAAQRAAEIIQRYGHNQIDTEHILLALIEQPQGVIPQILDLLKDRVPARGAEVLLDPPHLADVEGEAQVLANRHEVGVGSVENTDLAEGEGHGPGNVPLSHDPPRL